MTARRGGLAPAGPPLVEGRQCLELLEQDGERQLASLIPIKQGADLSVRITNRPNGVREGNQIVDAERFHAVMVARRVVERHLHIWSKRRQISMAPNPASLVFPLNNPTTQSE